MEILKVNLSGAVAGRKNLIVSILLVLGFTDDIRAQQWTPARPDGTAPNGVMGDHTPSAVHLMFSYKYMTMSMDGMRMGTHEVSSERVLQDFMVTPTDMKTQMHMFGLMHAPTNYISLMGMIPYVIKYVNHLTSPGVRFKTESEGLGGYKIHRTH